MPLSPFHFPLKEYPAILVKITNLPYNTLKARSAHSVCNHRSNITKEGSWNFVLWHKTTCAGLGGKGNWGCGSFFTAHMCPSWCWMRISSTASLLRCLLGWQVGCPPSQREKQRKSKPSRIYPTAQAGGKEGSGTCTQMAACPTNKKWERGWRRKACITWEFVCLAAEKILACIWKITSLILQKTWICKGLSICAH